MPDFPRSFHIAPDGANLLGRTVTDDEKELNRIPVPEDEDKRAWVSETGKWEVWGGEGGIGGGVRFCVEIHDKM